MIDKPIIIILFMYSVSFSTLAGQYVIADVFDITLRNFQGVEIKSSLINATNIETVNIVTSNITDTDYTITDVAGAFSKAGGVLVELLLLLTGTYIFFILYLLGVPSIIIVGMVALYAIMLGNTIIAKIRGI